MPEAEPDVRLERVTKRFGDHVVVDALDLEIERGAFFALLGPSGCGKTTTLRMIGGFERLTAGRVHLGGRDVTDLPPFRRDVNTVFQSYALFPHLTVERNVAFGLERRRVGREEIRRRVAEALEMVQLGAFGRRRPAQLSGGQQQRVALARALVNRPRALLLDEPLGALDLRLRKELQLELARLQHELGLTFVHVTHDQEEAMSMADTIAVMRDGRIEQAGTATELYEAPRTAFVASFLGISNFIDGRVTGRDGGVAAVQTHDGATLRLPAARLAARDDVRIGVRPEKVQLARPQDDVPDGWNVLRGTVVVAAFLGVSIQYLIRSAGGDELTVIAPNRDGTPPDAFTAGRDVLVTWNPDFTFVVDQEDSP